MDCLPLGVHAFLVPLIFCVLNSVVCQPFMHGLYPYPMPRMFPMMGVYPPFNSFERMRYFNDWNQRYEFYRRSWIPRQYRQNIRSRQQFGTTQSRDHFSPITRLPVGHSDQSPRKPTYQYTGITNTPTKVVTRAPTLRPNKRPIHKKPKLRLGSLADVIPHPKPKVHQGLSMNHRVRYKSVAKAKSFSGIIKNTALEHKRP